MGLDGKVIIITGPAAGIGAATAKLFASRGAKLCLLDIDEAALKRVEADCRELGADVLALKCDVSLLSEMDEAISETIRRFDGIDILVNNGLDPIGNDLSDCTFEQFARHQINTAGYFELARLLRIERGTQLVPADETLVAHTPQGVRLLGKDHLGVSRLADVAAVL